MDGIQEKVPTFRGLKFSDTDLLDFGQCVNQHRQRRFAFLYGVDEVSHRLACPIGQFPPKTISGAAYRVISSLSFHESKYTLSVSDQQLLSALVMGATGAVGR